MIMSKKLADLVDKKRKCLSDYLKGIKKCNEIVPAVRRAKEDADWLSEVLKEAPPVAARDLGKPQLEGVIRQDLDIWTGNLPSLKINPSVITNSGSAASGTASEVVFKRLIDFKENSKDPSVTSFAESYIEDYIQLQTKQNKSDEVYNDLTKINSNLAKEFKQANQACLKADNGILQANEAAINMRNVLEHFIGELLELTRRLEKRQVKKKIKEQWLFISKNLAIGGTSSPEYELLQPKHKDHEEIHDELTKICKSQIPSPLPRLIILHIRWLDHLFTSLKLINLKKIRIN